MKIKSVRFIQPIFMGGPSLQNLADDGKSRPDAEMNFDDTKGCLFIMERSGPRAAIVPLSNIASMVPFTEETESKTKKR